MALTTLAGVLAAPRQRVLWYKSLSRSVTTAVPISLFDGAGVPPAGTLAVGNTANGLVHTDATTGYPTINAFGASATGYLAGVEYAGINAVRYTIFDRLFSCGAYAFNADTTLTSQPSYSSRVPGGTDFVGLEIWTECVTSFSGNWTIEVFYTNQSGTTGQTTGAFASGIVPVVGRMFQLPLQSGDTGVQTIERVVSTVSTAGTFNIHVMRRLWDNKMAKGEEVIRNDMLSTGLIQVFADSALFVQVTPDGSSTGAFNEIVMQIING